jgi:adenine phosphoribosyltransferase
VKRAGGVIIGARFIVDLPDLGGSDALAEAGIDSRSLLDFAGN